MDQIVNPGINAYIYGQLIFNKGANISIEKDSVSNKWYLDLSICKEKLKPLTIEKN